MIDKLIFYRTGCVDPYRNIAAEKYLTLNVKPGTRILYLWQNDKTVVIGRNQSAYRECNVTALEKDGGHLARRLSGGGAVYHDLGNLNFTFISRDEDYDISEHFSILRDACQSLGIDAEVSGRNDLTVDGRKFSGNAFYSTGGASYHHGTLLLKTDTDAVSKYLNVNREKLRSKGVTSVQARICNLSEFVPDMTPDRMAEALEEAVRKRTEGDSGQTVQFSRITDKNLPQETIESYRKELSSKEWLFERPIAFSKEIGARFDWGSISIEMETARGHISSVRVFSDAMDETLAARMERALNGKAYRAEELADALQTLKNDPLATYAKETNTGVIEDVTALLQEQI